ncbi:Crp/Fnr family transcriptional regulator [Desulfovibrio sp.]|uniref:Crp/Fnr family transcriptional regulator n=1 Tax=Desulfovibrio sp. TaxID=885 RepID=UPI003077BD14
MRSFWHLEKGDFFDGIEEGKEHFLRSAQRIELKKNDIVFFEGDAGGACFYVASGLLRIFCVTEAGKESTFFLRTAGEIFGLWVVLPDLPLDRQAFDDLLSRNYALARRVITVMGSRLRYLGDSLSAQTCDVRHRVGRLLLSLAHESLRDPAAWEQPLALPVSLSQGQMAAMVCSTQPTVSETLHQLQDEGLIDIRGRGIVIRRPQALLAALESPADRA